MGKKMNVKLPKGYQARPATLDDLEAAIDLWNACSRELLGIEKFSLQDSRREWTTPNFNLETDTCIILDPSGKIVGYHEVWDLDEPHVTLNVWGRVHPEYRDLGLEACLLEWAEERSIRSIPKAPAGARVAMQSFALSSDEAGQEAYRRAGFQLLRHSLRMVIDLNGATPEPQWPEGITVRPMAVGQDEIVTLQAVRGSFKDHYGYVEHPFEDELRRWKHFMEHDEDFDPSLWFLAEEQGEVAGISLCRMKVFDDPEMGWVSTLGVLRPWRRRGLGLALLQHSFSELYRRGRRKIGLGVDAQSLTGATRLYEKAGMRPDPSRQHSMYEKVLRPGRDLRTVEVDEEKVISDQ
jgi:GNAT superfamily N-acetyltransferase